MAIYNRALTQDQINQNFEAGVGQKRHLLFKVGHLAQNNELPDSTYIWMEAGEFDNFAYYFANPKLIVLGNNPTPTTISGVTIGGMSIGVNGKIATVGQVYLNMNKSITMDLSTERVFDLIDQNGSGVIDGEQRDDIPTSATGTIIPKQYGPDGSPADQFYLTFENFNGAQGVSSDDGVLTGSLGYDYGPATTGLPLSSNYIAGVRTFEEINATMAELTDIAITDPAVRPVFLNLQQQLPSVADLQGFLASHQMGITKLALTYCGELVDDSTERSDVFGTIDLGTAFDTSTSQNNIVDALYNQMIGQNITGQPTRTEVGDLLVGTGGILERLSASCTGSCGATRNATILKSMCVSVLSSAAVTTQ
jgi:hypothetical protein